MKIEHKVTTGIFTIKIIRPNCQFSSAFKFVKTMYQRTSEKSLWKYLHQNHREVTLSWLEKD